MSQKRRHDSAEAGVSELLRQMLRKETDYSSGLRDNNDFLGPMSQRLSHGEGLENLLESSKLQEFRESVKKLAARNVEHDRQVKAYIQGLKHLEETCHQRGGGTTVDYSKLLKEAMINAHGEIQKNSVEVHQERLYLEVVDQLNEPKGRGGGDNDDEEIAILPSDNGGKSLKCPITTAMMVDPYKSKVCAHVYEKEAIMKHLRIRKECPVAGCINTKMTVAQLEPDKATANKIRREKVRQQRAQEHQAFTQETIDMDDEDEE